MADHYESFGGYRRLQRSIGPEEVKRAQDIFDRIIDEMKDSHTTSGMFEPYAKVVNFVLANRMIKTQLSENPRRCEETAEPLVRIKVYDDNEQQQGETLVIPESQVEELDDHLPAGWRYTVNE